MPTATNLVDRQRFAANLPRYFVYKVCEGIAFGLISTTWVIYLQQMRGFSLTQATLIDVAFWLAAALAEVPTGIVADAYGRKLSLVIGSAVMCVSIFAFALAPTLPLILLAYVGLAIGGTFLSGAQDAFFYESVQLAGRSADYTKLLGRASATVLGAIALGSIASGLLAALNLQLPFLVAGVSYLATLVLALSLREPVATHAEKAVHSVGQAYGAILRQSLDLLRSRPTLRYPLLYLASIPLVAIILDTVFLQPQSVALGVPVAGLGVILMAIRLSNMVGAAWAHWLAQQLGEDRIIVAAPLLIIACLLLLSAWQAPPTLIFVGVISLVTAIFRPLLMTRLQNAVANDIRATVLSLKQLILTALAAISEPILGVVADRVSLPASYVALAIMIGLASVLLFGRGRRYLLAGVSE